MFKRLIEESLKKAVSQFPITVLTGPRQSGKTTLLQSLFPDLAYVSLEFPDILLDAKEDPRDFLDRYHAGVIIDEVQNFPELFSYIQGYVDEKSFSGPVILSGSQNFLLSDMISQTLAGRAAILELPSLTYTEYCSHDKLQPLTLWDYLYHGSYPRPYQEKMDVKLWFEGYLRTYIERDVRALTVVGDLSQFQLFLRLCAGYHGQLLNISAIAQACGIAQDTASRWISLLESSYIVFRLQPYYKNFKKRLVKTPKLYFYDSALVTLLLGIESPDHLQIHSSRGAIFEGFVVSEVKKYLMSVTQKPSIYFWRDHRGLEVDLLIESGNELSAIEIKSGKTLKPDSFAALNKWKSLDEENHFHLSLVYAGIQEETRRGIDVLSWQSVAKLLG